MSRRAHLALAGGFLEALRFFFFCALFRVERFDHLRFFELLSPESHAIGVAHKRLDVLGDGHGFPRRIRERDDRVPTHALFWRDEGDARAFAAAVARATHAVNPFFGRHRNVVIDDETNARDVQTARGDVGRDEHATTAVRESFKCLFTLQLRAIAVDHRGRDIVSTQRACNPTRSSARCAVDNDAAPQILRRENRKKRRHFLFLVEEHALVREVRGSGVAHTDLDFARLREPLVHEIFNLSRKRG